MYLFKSVNEKLAEHIEELEDIGFLPENWYWSKDKILELDKIDRSIIKDLKKIYKENSKSKVYSHLQKMALRLHQDIESMIGEKNVSEEVQEDWAKEINMLLGNIRTLFSKDSLLYLKSLKRPPKQADIKLIDIKKTPLLFRREKSILAWIELERRGRMYSASAARKMYKGDQTPTDDVPILWFEAPLPIMYPRGIITELLDLEEGYDISIIKEYLELLKECKIEVYKEKQELSYKDFIPSLKYSKRFWDIMDRFLNNPNDREIYVRMQDLYLHPSFFSGKTDDLFNDSHGREGYGTDHLIVYPKNIKKFTFCARQTHDDYMSEIIAIKPVDLNDIVGYLTGDRDGKIKVSDKLKRIDNNINWYRSHSKDMQKKFFPFHDNYREGLMDYLRLRLGVDEDISFKDFKILICKRLGIPVYDVSQEKVIWHKGMKEEGD
ncbi:hypothetical protein GF345_03955 [Candidatus Woesearchaeota archaeon]|nr:hypothetical protein [Candidatus Woesearchaeota archaeon]